MNKFQEYIDENIGLNKKNAYIEAVNCISKLYESFIKDYSSKNEDSIEKFNDFDFFEIIELIEESGITNDNIPYTYITKFIFEVDIPIERNDKSGIEIRDFVELFKGSFEDYLDNKYKKPKSDNIEISKDQQIMRDIMSNVKTDDSLNDEYNMDILESDLSTIKLMYKLFDHIELAIEQKIGLYEKQKDQIRELNKAISNKEDTIEQLKVETENIKTLQKNAGKIYTEFVAILGIFASIIFGVFGGFQEIQLIGKNLNNTPIPKLLIFSSLVMTGITLIIFLCFNAVSKLTNLPLRSCNCEIDKCNCSFRKKHPTIVFSTCFFGYVMIVGFALRLYKYDDFKLLDMYNGLNEGFDILPLILILIPFICSIFYIFYKFIVNLSKKVMKKRFLNINKSDRNYRKIT